MVKSGMIGPIISFVAQHGRGAAFGGEAMPEGIGAKARSPALLAGAFLLVVNLLVLTAGLVLLLRETGERRRLEAEGRSILATVRGKSIHADRTTGGRTEFRVAYRFLPQEGQAVDASADIERVIWNELAPGGSLGVIYLPENPSIHRVNGQQRNLLLPLALAAIGGVLLFDGALFAWFMLRRPAAGRVTVPDTWHRAALSRIGIFARSWWLLFGAIWLVVAVPLVFAGLYQAVSVGSEDAVFAAEGQSVQGMVLSKAVKTKRTRTGSNPGRKTTHYRVTYRYATPDGDEVLGTSDIGADLWDGLRERGPIGVTYLPEAPWRHRVEGEAGGRGGAFFMLALGVVGTAIGGFGVVQGLRRLRRSGQNTSATVPADKRWEPPQTPPAVEPRTAAPVPIAGLSALAGSARLSPTRWIFIPLPRAGILPGAGAIFFLVGVFLGIDGARQLATEWRYTASGMLAEGRVVAKTLERAERRDGGATRYVAFYRFKSAEGGAFEGQYVLPVERWEALEEGDPVSVRYLPEQPQINREAGESGMVDAIVTLVLAFVATAVGGGLLYAFYRRRRQAP